MTQTAGAEKKKVLLVEDHPIFRAMLAQLINGDPNMTVCGEVDNIRDAMILTEKTRPDMAIVDITLQGSSGLEFIKDMKARKFRVPVLVLSMHEESLYAERVLRAGGRGYVSKLAPPAVVVAAIRKVLEGGIYLDAGVTESILGRLGQAEDVTKATGMDLLSDREIEVFQLVGRGMNSREISERLNLGLTTVDSYRQRIKEKLRLKNAAALYQSAAQWLVERNL